MIIMTNITLIAACDTKGCIGKGNKLPWNIRSEMDYFLNRVAFRPLIMGKNTCLSLHKPINSNINYVLTTDKDFYREGFVTVNSIEEMLSIMNDNLEYYVVGGAQIYRQFLELAEQNKDIKMIVELSIIHTIVEGGDSYFPLELLDKSVGYKSQIIHEHMNNEMKWHVSAYYKERK